MRTVKRITKLGLPLTDAAANVPVGATRNPPDVAVEAIGIGNRNVGEGRDPRRHWLNSRHGRAD